MVVQSLMDRDSRLESIRSPGGRFLQEKEIERLFSVFVIVTEVLNNEALSVGISGNYETS